MRDDARDLDHIPGDEGPPLINKSLAILRDAWAADDALFGQFGPVARTRVLGRTVILLGTADLASQHLLDRDRALSSRDGWGHLLGQLFPRGLMLRDFDDHARDRRIMQAAFRGPARAAYHTGIDAHFARMLEAWVGDAEHDTLAFFPAVKRVLLEQAGIVFLGLEPGPHIDLLFECFVDILRATVAFVRLDLPGTSWRRGLVGRRRLAEFIRAEIPGRRGSSDEARDLLSLLCRAEDEDGARFDDEAIVDHMIFLLFAAHDTTAVALTTLIDELSSAPELLERVAAECLTLRGDGPSPAALPHDRLAELELTDRCLREALRVNPPVPYILRRTVRTCPIGGHELPAKTPANLVVRAIHRDPSVWTEPDRFDPDRFAPDRAEHRGHPHAFVPFGGGAHRCIGAELARQQAKTFCYHLLSRYRVERVDARPTQWRRLPLARPVDDLPIRLVRRRGLPG